MQIYSRNFYNVCVCVGGGGVSWQFNLFDNRFLIKCIKDCQIK